MELLSQRNWYGVKEIAIEYTIFSFADMDDNVLEDHIPKIEVWNRSRGIWFLYGIC